MCKYLGIAALVALLTAGAVFFIMRTNDAKTRATVTIEGIREIAHLATVEYTITEIVPYEKDKSWFEWQTANMIVVAKGIVTGSVDLDKMDVNVSSDPNKKTVTLNFGPGAIQVSDPQIGEGDIQYILVSDPNIFNKMNAADYTTAHDKAITTLKQAALSQGIIEKTASGANTILTRFLQSLGYTATIQFADIDLGPATDTTTATPTAVP
jgi:hypothetical protein